MGGLSLALANQTKILGEVQLNDSDVIFAGLLLEYFDVATLLNGEEMVQEKLGPQSVELIQHG